MNNSRFDKGGRDYGHSMPWWMYIFFPIILPVFIITGLLMGLYEFITGKGKKPPVS
jgi:hypothetical protein